VTGLLHELGELFGEDEGVCDARPCLCAVVFFFRPTTANTCPSPAPSPPLLPAPPSDPHPNGTYHFQLVLPCGRATTCVRSWWRRRVGGQPAWGMGFFQIMTSRYGTENPTRSPLISVTGPVACPQAQAPL
jgi:hypothetical protein